MPPSSLVGTSRQFNYLIVDKRTSTIDDETTKYKRCTATALFVGGCYKWTTSVMTLGRHQTRVDEARRSTDPFILSTWPCYLSFCLLPIDKKATLRHEGLLALASGVTNVITTTRVTWLGTGCVRWLGKKIISEKILKNVIETSIMARSICQVKVFSLWPTSADVSVLSLRRRPYVCSLFSVLACFTFHCIRSSCDSCPLSCFVWILVLVVLYKYTKTRASLAREERVWFVAKRFFVFVLGSFLVCLYRYYCIANRRMLNSAASGCISCSLLRLWVG